jgi:threonine dehydratase
MTIPTLAEIRAARDLLAGVATVTPIQGARWLSEAVGGPVWMKAENLQRAGSFKIRGAFTRISGLSEAERARGVVAASAGNHAQGVALAASLLGIKATVFMPEGAPIPKVKATRGYGAEVIFHGSTIDEALVMAQELSDREGAVLVHPFDHKDIVAGQGTCGLELIEQRPDLRTVVVPTGGGGLVGGMAIALKGINPDIRVIGVQAEAAAAYPKSLAEGHPVALTEMSTMADGIAVGRPGVIPFEAVSHLVDDVLTVSEEAISQALVLLLERNKLVVEPAGAVAVAAIREHPELFEPPVAAVLSGGNIDPLLLLHVIRHGLAAAGRYLVLGVRINDRPGGLADLLAALARTHANIIDVIHDRTSPLLPVHAVDVTLQVETRGADHAEAVVRQLRGEGYEVSQPE